MLAASSLSLSFYSCRRVAPGRALRVRLSVLHSTLYLILYSALFMAALLLSGCAQLPAHVDRPPSWALHHPEETGLGRIVAASAPRPGISGFRLLLAGTDALDDRVQLIDHAERTIDLQYYIIQNDSSVRVIAEHLLAAAERGVRIRVLVDDFHTVGSDGAMMRFDRHPNIEVRLFNPFPGGRFATFSRFLSSFGDISRLNRRMHNKLFIVDNVVGIAGGRNLGDQYFVRNTESNFVDLDVMAAGPIVRRMSQAFDQYWNDDLSWPVGAIVGLAPDALGPDQVFAATVDADAMNDGVLGHELQSGKLNLEWAPATVLVDRPSKVTEPEPTGPDEIIIDKVLDLMRGAQHEVLLVSPYFVPGEPGMEMARDHRRRGVAVKVLTNSLASTDAPIVHIGYSRYRQPMLELGVNLYELRPTLISQKRRGVLSGGFGSSRASLHAKVICIDRTTLFIGSMNLDPRSAYENTEIGIVIRSPVLAAEVGKVFDDALQDDTWRLSLAPDGSLRWNQDELDDVQVFDREPQASPWLPLQLWLLTPLAPEELL